MAEEDRAAVQCPEKCGKHHEAAIANFYGICEPSVLC